MSNSELPSLLERLRRRADEPLRPSGVREPELSARVDALREDDPALASLLHLWNDDLHGSHDLSQQLHDPTGSYLHGMMHRREGDFSNACYWFRRCSEHPIRRRLADRLAAEAELAPELREQLGGDRFDPTAFVDACERRPDDPALRRVQRLEMEVLLEILQEPA